MFIKIKKSTWSLLFACCCMFALGLSDNIRGPLFPELLAGFNLNNSVGSLSFALTSAAALLGTAGSVYFLKVLSIDYVLGIATLGMGSGMIVMGVSADFLVYMLGSFLFGFSMGLTGVAQNLLIAENLTETKQTKGLSALHSIYGFSSLLAPFLASLSPNFFAQAAPNIKFLATWQSAFYSASLICVLVCLSMICFKVEPQFTVHVPEEVKQIKINKKLAFSLAAFFATYVGAEILISSRLALYMRTYHDMNLQESSKYVTYFFVFLLIGRITFAIKSFKWPLKHQMNASLSASLLFLVLGMSLHPFFLALVGLAMAPFYPIAVSYISNLTGVKKRAYVTFVMSMQSLLVIGMHLGVGFLSDLLGLFYAFGVGVILLLLSLICLNTHARP